MEARAEQPSPSQEKGRGNQLEPVPPIRHLRRLHPGWFCGIERSRSTFSSAFAPARFLRPGWFCGTNASAGGPVLSVPTIWVAFGFVYARVGLLDVLLSRTDVPGVLWIWNSFRSPLQETPDTKSRRTRDFVAQPILAVLLSGSWTISKAWRMTPVYPEPAEGPSLPEVERSLSSRLRREAQKTHHEVGGLGAARTNL